MHIKPYKIAIDQTQLDDLHNRLKATRWPEPFADDDNWERGVPPDYLKKLADHWLHKFDWRKQEAELNKYDQFVAEVDGQPIHFFHVKSKEPNARPLMLLHGWPSSGVEFIKMIGHLTDPGAHGGKAEDAFHVVIPTIPGFGLSTPVKDNWDVKRTSQAFDAIMRELGYESYGMSGTDIGGGIASTIDQLNPNITGILAYTDLMAVIWFSMLTGDPSQSPKLSETQKKEVQTLMQKRKSGDGYLAIQTTRPLTIGYGLNDSPVGQLAWMIEKYKEWTGDDTQLPEKKLDIDHALTNISLYWFTGSGLTAANLLYNNAHAAPDWGGAPHAPTGMVAFNAHPLTRLLLDPQKQMPYWTEHKPGGHFPAMEVPELLAGDLRAFFATLKK